MGYDHHWTIKILPVQCSNACHSNLPLDHGDGLYIMSMDVYCIGFTVTIVPTCSKPLMGELTMLTPFEDFLPRLDRKTLAIHGMILQVGERVQHGDCLDSCASMTCQWCSWPTLDTNSPQTHELERLVWVKNILVTIQVIILACTWTNKFVKPIVSHCQRSSKTPAWLFNYAITSTSSSVLSSLWFCMTILAN